MKSASQKIVFCVTAAIVGILVIGLPVLKHFEHWTAIAIEKNLEGPLAANPTNQISGEIQSVKRQVKRQWDAYQEEKDEFTLLESEELLFNIFQTSHRLKTAEEWVNKENVFDAQRYLASAKNYLAENKKIIDRRQSNTEGGRK